MNDKLKKLLANGETILFSTKAEAFTTLDKTNKRRIVLRMVLALSILAILLIFYFIKAQDISYGIVLIVTVIVCVIAFRDFSTAQDIRKFEYVITDKHVISLGKTDEPILFKDIKQYDFSVDEDNHVSLLIGEKAIKAPTKKWRNIAVSPVVRDEKTAEVTNFVIYAIENADAFKDAFMKAVDASSAT